MVDATLMKFYRSAAGGASLGKDITSTEIVSGTMNNLFTTVSRAQQVAGFDHYLCMYLKNTSDEEMRNISFWLSSDTPTNKTTVKWATEATPNFYKYQPFHTFNGSSDFIDVADSAELDVFDFTVALWFKTNTDYSGSEGAMANKGGFGSDTAGQNMNYGLWIDTANKLKGGFETSAGTDRFVTSPRTVNDNLWHHAAVTYNRSTLILYLDGVQVATLATTDVPEDNALPFTLGKNSRASDRYFNGLLDEVRVW